MKTILTFLTLTISISFLNILTAQDTIPNSGFEYWNSATTVKYWETTNIFLPPGTNTCFRTEDSHSGDYAMLLQTIKIDGDLIPGVATCGTIDYYSASGGAPYTDRPSVLTGYVKHPGHNDSVFIAVQFFKNGEQIGGGIWGTKDSIPEYSQFIAPISYNSSVTPDTVNIIILTDWNKQGSTLMVDDLEFSIQTSTLTHSTPSSKLNVYPNPASNFINIETPFDANYTVQIFNLSGIKVKEMISGFVCCRIDIGNLPLGTYVLVVESADRKQIKRKIIIKS